MSVPPPISPRTQAMLEKLAPAEQASVLRVIGNLWAMRPVMDAPPPDPDAKSIEAGLSPREIDQALTDLHCFDAYRDPDFLNDAAKAYSAVNHREGLRWLHQVAGAVRENGAVAFQRLLAGDGEGAVAAWRTSKRHCSITSATRNWDWSWTIRSADSKPVRLSHANIRRWLLSLQQFLVHNPFKSPTGIQ